ncbi:MAG: hypothetical protein N2738_00050, partial [Thermodesulfovibrionales bacterium]|nr:hypothetical protein [Thermodesulfovibrionales bacterium]
PSNYSWGGSVIWDGTYYNIVTFDSFNSNKLYVYKYNSNWDFISQKLLIENNQWSQGLLWDGKYYYVSYHKGDHNHGNVSIGIFDAEWNILTEVQVTNYSYSNGINAQRPFLIKVGKLIFISYDLETYNTTTGENNKDWQSQVDVYQISP